MEVRLEIVLLILACMLVTVLSRTLPMFVVNHIKLPTWLLQWLQNIPLAVISVLFFREVLLVEGDWRSWQDPYFLAAVPTLIIAFISRNIFITVIAGMLFFLALRYLL